MAPHILAQVHITIVNNLLRRNHTGWNNPFLYKTSKNFQNCLMTKFSLWNWTEHLIQKSFTLTLILRCKQNIQFGMFSAWGKLQKSATTEKWKKKWISQYTIHTKVTWFKISQRRHYFFFSFKIMLECISFGQSGVLTNCQLPIYMSKTPPNNFFVQRSSALYGPEPAYFSFKSVFLAWMKS